MKKFQEQQNVFLAAANYSSSDDNFRDDTRQWYDISDSYVHKINFNDVRKQQAYLLFYERVC